MFIDHPDMRPYFYDGVPIESESPDYLLALSIAQMRLDFFDEVLKQERLFPDRWPLDLWNPHIEGSVRRQPRDVRLPHQPPTGILFRWHRSTDEGRL